MPSWPTLDLDRPVFLVGSGRSGTTLTAELLDCPPYFTCLFEMQSLVLLLGRVAAGTVLTPEDLEVDRVNCAFALSPEAEYNWRILRHETDLSRELLTSGLERTSLVPDVVRMWADTYHGIQASRGRAARVLHKTPGLATRLVALRRLWPLSKVIHVIRDPRAVVFSYLNVEWGPASVNEAVDWYCRRVGDALTFGRGHDWYYEILYERLVGDSAAQIEELATFLEVPRTCMRTDLAHIRPAEGSASWTKMDASVCGQILAQVHARVPQTAAWYQREHET